MSSVFDNSCRICLSPDTALVNIFGSFNNRSVNEIIENICEVKLSRNESLPQFICENCMSKLLQAESIKHLCYANEKFLLDLLEASCLEASNIADSQDQEEIVDNETSEVIIEECVDWEPLLELNEKSKTINKIIQTRFFCAHCFKEFNTRAKCLYHEKAKHLLKPSIENEKKFTCDRCGVKFAHKSHVINHLNVVHLKVKRYQCTTCGRRFYSKSHHTSHMKTHSNIKDFRCSDCGKSFSRKESVLVHQRTHSNVRPFKCKFCDRSYTAHTDLKRHLFTHTRVHPYICQLCKKGFFLKRLLRDHVNSDHPSVDATSWLNGKTLHHFSTKEKL